MQTQMSRCWAISFLLLYSFSLTNALCAHRVTQPSPVRTPPKVILTLVIDQFRADYLTRFESRFLPAKQKNGKIGGFEYLKSYGAYFPQGQYDIMQSITAPGHASILTGAYPYQAGIVLNSWFDQNLKRDVYCSEDSQFPLVGPSTQGLKHGMSPKHLNATTVGDELKNAGYPSKVVAIALKERSAIFLGGHRADLALWYDQTFNQWVSSCYYLPAGELPEWVIRLNRKLPQLGQTITWNNTPTGTGFSDEKANLFVKGNNAAIIGQTFPHSAQFGTYGSLATPFGYTLTLDAAEAAFLAYRIGKGPKTDLFAVSFSNFDLVGHAFGPNTREMEEMTVTADAAISHLLNFVNKNVPGGLSNVVIAFTADHGAPSNPEWGVTHQLKAGRINEKELAQTLSAHLNETFGKPKTGSWILNAIGLNFYLNHLAIKDRNIDVIAMEAAAKAFLEQDSRAAFVFTFNDYKNRKLPPGILERQILHTYYPGRNGDVVMIPRPYFIPGEVTTNHVTGYSYDRTVPIILAGPYIKAGQYATRAEVVDIAPTLSFLTGTIPPNLCEGRVLAEILQ